MVADCAGSVPASYTVAYIASGLHPCCLELAAHYYALRMKKNASQPQQGSSSSTLRPVSSSAGKAPPPQQEEAVVIVGVLEYDYLVQIMFERLLKRRASGILRHQMAHAGEREGPMPWKRSGAIEHEWAQLTRQAPVDTLMRALRASRVSTLFFPDQTAAATFHESVASLADRGGHFLSNFDISHDVVPTVTSYATRSMMGGLSCPVGGGPSSIKSSFSPSDVIFVHLDAPMGQGTNGPRASGRSGSATAQTAVCRTLQEPRPMVRRSPRTYTLWMRLQLMRDAVDALLDHDRSMGRQYVMDPLLDGQLWVIMSQPSDSELIQFAQPNATPARAAQISQIRSTFEVAGGSHDPLNSVFFPRFRLCTASTSATHSSAAAAAPLTGRGGQGLLSLQVVNPVISDARAVEAQRRIPLEMALHVLQAWLDILVLLAPSKPWLFAALMHQASSYSGFVDVEETEYNNAVSPSTDDYFPSTKCFLLELEKLRRRRAAMVQSVVVTASVAAKNDLVQSNVVRIVETWVRARFEKTIGQVGNLVGARMTVEPNWNTEAHPQFGQTMRTTHFPLFLADGVMLDGCVTPLIPLPVMRCRNEWRRVVQLDPVLYRFRTLTVHLATTVAKLSKRLVCSPGDLSLLPNRESAIATILRSLPLLPGDSIILVDPPLDGAFTHVAAYLERRHGVDVHVLRLDPFASNEAMQRTFLGVVERMNPVLCMMNWVAPSTRVLPVEYFVSLCGQRAVLSLVDGTDAVGNLSVSVAALDCDVFVARLDNYMFCPRGITALVVKPKMNKLLTTLTVSYYYRPPVYGAAAARVTNATGVDDDEGGDRGGLEADMMFGGGTTVSPWGTGAETLHGNDEGAITDVQSADSDHRQAVTGSRTAGTEGGRVNKAFASGLPVVAGSVYSSEWWYTGLSDMSSALAVTQGLQFKKFICFGAKEYCFRIAQEAEAYLCHVWQVRPLLPVEHSMRHSIMCVEVPRSHGKGAPDAAHLQKLLSDHHVFVSVLALPLPPEAQATATRRVSSTLPNAKRTTLLAVRVTVQVYNSMRDIKHLAAAGIRVVSTLGW